MQDASLQESMGPIQDRTRSICAMTDQGNRRDAKPPASGGQAAREGKKRTRTRSGSAARALLRDRAAGRQHTRKARSTVSFRRSTPNPVTV